jgi:hypothetical protein
MTTIYLGGPMRGYSQFNFKEFDRVGAILREHGYDVLSPAEHDRETGFDETLNSLDGFDLEEAMLWDLAAVERSDSVIFLHGWQKSEGCRMEYEHAKKHKKFVYEFTDGQLPGGFSLQSVLSLGTSVNTGQTDVDRVVTEPRTNGMTATNLVDTTMIFDGNIVHPGKTCPWTSDGDCTCEQEDTKSVNERAHDTVPLHVLWADIAKQTAGSLQPMEDPYEAGRQKRLAASNPAVGVTVDPVPLTEQLREEKKRMDAAMKKLFRGLGSDEQEQRLTSPTGAEKGAKLARYDLIPPGPLKALAEHYGRGARKYADRNWEKGYDWSLCFAAMMRHAWAFWAGEDIDPETGSPHLAAVQWHACALQEFATTHPDYDDRPSTRADEEYE